MADASHELRTPVSVVRTTAQVTLAQPARPRTSTASRSPSSKSSPRAWRASSTRCSCCRARRRRAFRLMREPLYLDDLVAECARALRVFADERGRRCTRRRDDGGVVLRRRDVAAADGRQSARQRHSPRAGWVARHRRRSRATPAGVTIRVTDDGDGIPAQEQGRIFERFVRFDGRSEAPGSGCRSRAGLRRPTAAASRSSRPAGAAPAFSVTLPEPAVIDSFICALNIIGGMRRMGRLAVDRASRSRSGGCAALAAGRWCCSCCRVRVRDQARRIAARSTPPSADASRSGIRVEGDGRDATGRVRSTMA